jgi:hypothetical protein
MTQPVVVIEPACWGMTGVPLLPPSWAKGLKDHYFEVHRRKTTLSSLSILCSSSWNLDWINKKTPIQFAVEQLEPLLATRGIEDLLELPAVPSFISEIDNLKSIPFLTSTWESLEGNRIDMDSFARVLIAGSFADLFQLTNSMKSVLDIAITTAQWIDERGRVLLAAEAHGIHECFELTQIRHMLQSGFPLPTSEIEARWIPALSSRIGLNVDGEVRTLEYVGRELGLTRERIRQVEQKYSPTHLLIRRWPRTPILEDLEQVLSKNDGSDIENINSQLRTISDTFGTSPTRAVLNLLRVSGFDAQAHISNGVLSFGDLEVARSLPSPGAIRNIANKLAGSLGFLREPDLVRELHELYPEHSEPTLRYAMRNALPIVDLPFEYVFTRSITDSTVVGIARRMLACSSPLSIEVIHEGIARRSRGRNLDSPPSCEVLEAFYSRLPDFEVIKGLVSTSNPTPPNSGSIVEWMISQIRESGLGAISRTVLLEAARTSGLNQTSVAIYYQFEERLVRLPQSCIGVVGEIPDPALIDIAAEQGRLIAISTRISYKEQGAIIVLDVLVGNSFIDSGTLSAKTSIRKRFGNTVLPIYFDDVQRGHVGVSGNLLYGFSSMFIASNTRVGDVIRITIDFTKDRVVVTDPFDEAAE